MLYGFTLHSEDLFKLDQIICGRSVATVGLSRKHRSQVKSGSISIWIEQLRKQPELWRVGSNLMIEKLVDGEESTQLGEALMTLNLPFAPNRGHTISVWRTSLATGPLEDWFRLLQSKGAIPEVRRHANDILNWVAENIFLTPKNKKEIQWRWLIMRAILTRRFDRRSYQVSKDPGSRKSEAKYLPAAKAPGLLEDAIRERRGSL
jgi:hypothetical protein